MVRVESQVTRQALLVVGDEMESNPPPEKLELFTEDGLAVDVGKDRTRARWRGQWVITPDAPYEQNDFVMHDDKLYILSDFEAYNGIDAPPASGWTIMTISGGMAWKGEWDSELAYKQFSVVAYNNTLWVAPDDILPATEPGFVVPDVGPTPLFTNRGVLITEADRFNSIEPVEFTIDDELGRDNDIGGGLGAVIYLDKTGALPSGTTLTITPIERVGGADSMDVSCYYPGGTYRPEASGTLVDADVDAQTPLVLDIDDDGANDMVFHIYFGSTGPHGSFTAELSDNTNLVAPPVIEEAEVQWEKLLPEGGGYKGSWVDDVQYPSGSIVEYDGSFYGSKEEPTAGMAPDAVPGSNVGSVYSGIQATTLDRMDDGVSKTFHFDSETPVDTGGARTFPMVIDLVGSLANLNVHIENDANSSISFIVDGGSVGGTFNNVDEGAVVDRTLQAATYFGGSGTYVLTMRLDSDAVGDVTVTVTGADLVPPDPTNTWMKMGAAEGFIPAGGDEDEVLVKLSGTDFDVAWAPPSGGGGGDLVDIEIEDWHEVGAGGEPAFANSWVAHSSTDHKPRFRKRPDGTVEMRGLIVSGSSDQAAFVLPVGYRPVSPGGLQMVAMAADTGTGNPHSVRVDVEPDGSVKPYISGSSIIWLSLASIEFSTGQDTFPAGMISAEAWHIVGGGGEPAFQNSWGAGSPAVTKFRKRADGVVEIRGFAVKTGGSGRTVAFTLPVGYRITSDEDVMRFPLSGSSGGYAEVFSNGDVKLDDQGYVSLDPIQFSVD